MIKFSVVKWEKLWWTVSAVLCLGSIAAMIISYSSLGSIIRPSLDFVGGTRLQVELDCTVPNNCDQPLTVNQVREVLDSQGLASSSIQIVGKDQQGISIRTKTLDVEKRTQLQDILKEKVGVFNAETTQIDTNKATIPEVNSSFPIVGPTVSI